MGQTLVSVIIPVFNGEAYIAEAIESVFSQTYPRRELIVIDDGSTDDTQALVRRYDDHLRSIHQEHKGVSAARNHGLRLARGEYVVFLDADDILLDEKLAEQSACLDVDDSAGCIHSGWHQVDAQGNIIRTVEPWVDAPRLDLEEWLTWCPFYLPALMFRRSRVEEVGGFDPTLPQAEDADFLLRLGLAGCPTVWLRKPTVCYRQHEASTMHNGPQQAACITRVMTSFFARPDCSRDLDRLADKILFNTAIWSAWQVYATGHGTEVTKYLVSSMAYRSESREEMLRLWLDRFAHASADKGYDLDDLRSLWPQFRQAIEADDAVWPALEQTLERWLKFMKVLHAPRASQNREYV